MILNPSWQDFEILNQLIEKKNAENKKLRETLQNAVDSMAWAHDIFVDEWNHGNKQPQFNRAMKELSEELIETRKILENF